MKNINIILAGKNINNNTECYHIVFKAKVDANTFSYVDIRFNKVENNKYEHFLNIDIVNSLSFGNIKDKYIINSSSYENTITYISNTKMVFKNISYDLETKFQNIIQRSNNVYFNALNKLKSTPKHIKKIPNCVLECINNRNKFEQEKNF